MPGSLWGRLYEAFRLPFLAGLVILLVGAFGYWYISGFKATLLDCVYMTFVTVATIGYSEIIDLSASPGGRIFTMLIGTAGIVNVAYTTSKLTAFIVESDLNEVLRRRSMQDRIDALSGHYIICGVGRVGGNVAQELLATRHPFVAIDDAQSVIDAFRERHPKAFGVQGDCSDDEVLRGAGIERAAGVFAVTGDDGKNLLITLTVKQLNPAARVVARCHEVRNIDKLKRVGADAIVSPDFTGGLRIASSMIRPVVVAFLDDMLRSDSLLRVEEIRVPDRAVPRPLAALAPRSRDYIVLAVRTDGALSFNPPEDSTVRAGDVLIVMTSPDVRAGLEARVTAGG